MKKGTLLFTLFAFAVITLFSGCKCDDAGTIALQINYTVGGEDVEMDTVKYVNPAGNTFSITKLEYYISNITFKDNSGNQYATSDVYYINMADPTTNTIVIPNVPQGSYTSVEFLIGLDATANVSGGLPSETVHNNMAWPDPMGGGYHFMKLEGRYESATTSPALGFGMHLGRTGFDAPNTASINATVDCDETASVTLEYDILEWHKNPVNWDFDVDGVAIMGDTTAQRKLSNNGVDIF